MKLSWHATCSTYNIHKIVISNGKEMSTKLYRAYQTSACEIDVETNTIYKFEIRALSDVGDLKSEPTSITFSPQK